jgi:hypothetical protein
MEVFGTGFSGAVCFRIIGREFNPGPGINAAAFVALASIPRGPQFDDFAAWTFDLSRWFFYFIPADVIAHAGMVLYYPHFVSSSSAHCSAVSIACFSSSKKPSPVSNVSTVNTPSSHTRHSVNA